MGAPRSVVRFIEAVQELVPVEGRLDHRWLPDGRTRLVLRVHADGSGDLCVAGPRTRAMFKQPQVARAVVVQLGAGHTAQLGVGAHELTDRIVDLEAMWGASGRALYEALHALDAPRIAARIADAITQRAADEPASARLARRAAQLLENAEMRVEQVGVELGVTARHLRRAFHEHIGVGPKEFARAARLQRVLRMAATSRDWSQIAVAAGYYDQAHLIAEFRALVGVTPVAFIARRDSASA
jgi:AraC-like DNA-binding protein